MALISCPECGKKVSDKARTCPQCAYPISEGAINNAATKQQATYNSSKVQTIEQTGKKYKAQILLSAILFTLGFIITLFAFLTYSPQMQMIGIGTTLLGATWYFMVKLLSWWHHG